MRRGQQPPRGYFNPPAPRTSQSIGDEDESPYFWHPERVVQEHSLSLPPFDLQPAVDPEVVAARFPERGGAAQAPDVNVEVDRARQVAAAVAAYEVDQLQGVDARGEQAAAEVSSMVNRLEVTSSPDTSVEIPAIPHEETVGQPAALVPAPAAAAVVNPRPPPLMSIGLPPGVGSSTGTVPRTNVNRGPGVMPTLCQRGQGVRWYFGSEPLPIRKMGIMFGGLDSVPTDPAIDPPPKSCHNCWQGGHPRNQCSLPPSTRVYCHNCGRLGVNLRNCPRCARAHREYLRTLERQRGAELAPLRSQVQATRAEFPSRQERRERETAREPAVGSIGGAEGIGSRRPEHDIQGAVLADHVPRAEANDPVVELRLLAESVAHLAPELQQAILRSALEGRDRLCRSEGTRGGNPGQQHQ